MDNYFWKAILLLPRWIRAFYAIESVLGLLILHTSDFHLETANLMSFLYFLFFFQLAYYSVYIINDLLDYKADKVADYASNKPLVKYPELIPWAIKILVVLITIGLFGAFVISKRGSVLILIALLYNLLYTLVLKHISLEVRILSVSLTHIFRVLLPFLYFGYTIPVIEFLPFWLSYETFVLKGAIIRRELDGAKVSSLFKTVVSIIFYCSIGHSLIISQHILKTITIGLGFLGFVYDTTNVWILKYYKSFLAKIKWL